MRRVGRLLRDLLAVERSLVWRGLNIEMALFDFHFRVQNSLRLTGNSMRRLLQ